MENNTFGTPGTSHRRRASRLPLIIFLIAAMAATNLATWSIARSLPSQGSAISVAGADQTAMEYINRMILLEKKIQDEYLWDVDEEKLWISAIKGLVAGTGDIYSSYMTSDEFQAFETSSTNFDGIGVQITNNESGNVEITKVFANTPAFKAGLQIGDQIVGVDDVSLIGKSTEFAITYLRGPKGTSATLSVLRAGVEDELKVPVTRDTIVNSFVDKRMIDSEIGYVHLSEFGYGASASFTEAIKDLEKQGMKRMIMDLRQNPGGNVYDALEIADYLLPECEIMYTLDKKGNRESYNSKASYDNIPLVVLVDENSASASEIVAGALQDNKRAIIVGTKSFGKGIIQFIKPLDRGSMYKLTYQEYYVPSGKKIHGEGISPDVAAESNEKYKKTLIELIPNGEDVQLQKAIDTIKGIN